MEMEAELTSSVGSVWSEGSEWKHPFGVQVQRFTRLGLHPGLSKAGDSGVCPGAYEPKRAKCIRRANINHWQPWKVMMEAQEFAKNLGYEHTELLEERCFMRGHLGPGSHDINLGLFKQAEVSPCLDQNFGKQKRFRVPEKASPGPARYYVRPYSAKVEHEGTTFGCVPRFGDIPKPWSLPCNRYNVKEANSLAALLGKVVSKRGPYDCFTGPREPENIFNKFSKGKRVSPDKYYMWPSDIDVFLHHPRNTTLGKFNKAERFLLHPTSRNMLNDISTCYRDPRWPGPAHYVIADGIQVKPEQHYAFRITGLEVRPSEKWKISPGPGRYNIKPIKCVSSMKKNATSVFLSKTQRTEYRMPVYNSF